MPIRALGVVSKMVRLIVIVHREHCVNQSLWQAVEGSMAKWKVRQSAHLEY